MIEHAHSGVPEVVLVVTLNDLPGYHIREVLGEVVGVTARPQNRFTEGVRSLDGSLSEAGEQYLIAGRREAVERMAFHARNAGANAVLAMRFDHRVVSDTWVEICAYGTAVVAIPRRRAPRARREIPAQPEPALYETTMTAEAPA
jgi:uncharacterized protein YbjQ (UPF0145 family)